MGGRWGRPVVTPRGEDHDEESAGKTPVTTHHTPLPIRQRVSENNQEDFNRKISTGGRGRASVALAPWWGGPMAQARCPDKAAMWDNLLRVDWGRLTHAYGWARDVPDMLRGMVAHDEGARAKAWDDFFGAVTHQG